MIEEHDDYLIWTPTCPFTACGFVMEAIRIDLNAGLNPAIQCPRCLTGLHTWEFGEIIDRRWKQSQRAVA